MNEMLRWKTKRILNRNDACCCDLRGSPNNDSRRQPSILPATFQMSEHALKDSLYVPSVDSSAASVRLEIGELVISAS